MDYNKQIKGLITEAKQGLQYARFTSSTKTRMFIGLLPFIIENILLIAIYHIFNFACKLISAPVDYLNSFLKEERDGVRHLTQAVIYAIGFPIIFMFKITLSFLACSMYILWFMIMCLSYIITLGAIRWQPFLFDAKYNIKYDSTNYTPTVQTAKNWSIFQLILFIFYTIGFILVVIGPIYGYNYGFYYFDTHVTIGKIFLITYEIITIICIVSIFRKTNKPKILESEESTVNLEKERRQESEQQQNKESEYEKAENAQQTEQAKLEQQRLVEEEKERQKEQEKLEKERQHKLQQSEKEKQKCESLVVKDKTIQNQAFFANSSLGDALIKISVGRIGDYAFAHCQNLTKIKYEGTIAEWHQIQKGRGWNLNVPAKCVNCSDGDVAL